MSTVSNTSFTPSGRPCSRPSDGCAVISRCASLRAASTAPRRFRSGMSETPGADQFRVHRDRLVDAIDDAILVGLVGKLWLARTEDADRDVAIDGVQHGGVGEVAG